MAMKGEKILSIFRTNIAITYWTVFIVCSHTHILNKQSAGVYLYIISIIKLVMLTISSLLAQMLARWNNNEDIQTVFCIQSQYRRWWCDRCDLDLVYSRADKNNMIFNYSKSQHITHKMYIKVCRKTKSKSSSDTGQW